MRHSARAPIIAAALAGILLGASAGVLALTAPASAGPTATATPSPTASPTPAPTASPTPTPYPQSTPVITDVEPSLAYEYSGIAITGDNLRSSDGSCVVEIGGLGAYEHSCTKEEIIAVVPWNAVSGNVQVISNGIPSNAIHLQILPFEEGPGADIVPGLINVLTAPGADIAELLASEGDPPDAAEPLFDSGDPLLADWYTVTVPEGEEVAKCRAYAMHPQVLEVGPVVFFGVDDPTPTPTPRMLPPSGATQRHSRSADGAIVLMVFGGLVAAISAAFVARSVLIRRGT